MLESDDVSVSHVPTIVLSVLVKTRLEITGIHGTPRKSDDQCYLCRIVSIVSVNPKEIWIEHLGVHGWRCEDQRLSCSDLSYDAAGVRTVIRTVTFKDQI